MPEPKWEFWIDVGGTFTDIIARTPDGRTLSRKVLSSGVAKGAAAANSSPGCIIDPARAGDPADFWQDCTLHLLDASGLPLAERKVANFDPQEAALEFETPFELLPPAAAYELHGGEPAPILAVRWLMQLKRRDPIPPVRMRLGTTRGTNALLERKGAEIAFVTTEGFADVLEIGYQARPEIFALNIRKPSMLYVQVVEIAERIDAEGQILTPLDESQARNALRRIHESGIQNIAICLMNSYRNAAHEQALERIAQELEFADVTLSSRTSPLMKIVSRGDTTVVDAYLTPVIRNYVRTLLELLGEGSELKIMTSAGGLVDARHFVGKDSILSGPAGGVVGFASAAEQASLQNVIGFDMGGTSTDVSRFDGEYEYTYETEKAGVRISAPALAIETVAAGGGSICRFDGQKLVVGPDSAGADPGPACYGRGGPLTVTDCNLLLGRILERHFQFPLDREAARNRILEVKERVKTGTGREWSVEALADGFIRIANANMAKPIRTISLSRGYDVREYALLSFGGAGGQHACAIADSLGMRSILIPPEAGVLSAFGIGHADIKHFSERQALETYSENTLQKLDPVFAELETEARERVVADGIDEEHIEPPRRMLDMRYRGQDACITVPLSEDEPPDETFGRLHEQLYGYIHEGRDLEVAAVRVECRGVTEKPPPKRLEVSKRRPKPPETSTMIVDAKPQQVGVFFRLGNHGVQERLQPGDELDGPAIVIDDTSTIVIDAGWSAELTAREDILMRRCEDAQQEARASTEVDPVTLELFNNHFASVAEQMGATLQKTALSTNVKERLDFSCAVFTRNGDLVANAPHMPVHLGAMGETVRCILSEFPDIRPGDVFITNDPYRGGSHLPDVTVITPVHDESERLIFFTASRAHHAEIGGVVPGSMPPQSTSLAEEGVLIRSFPLIRDGQSHWDELEALLRAPPYPSRAVRENLADIEAQVAANRAGARLLLELCGRATLSVVLAYMDHIRDAAEALMRDALRGIPDGVYEFTDRLDDGTSICVKIAINGDEAEIDFTGSGAVVRGNLNANPAIVGAAVLYCFRCLLHKDIPLNEGVLAPLRLIVPEGLLNPPAHDDPARCAAIAAGNVETSQRVVDTVFGALGVVAASQGTMNNLIFGDETFGYYETICGGSGAGEGFNGASAVHTHMTNTRLTDPEVLESRYPVRLRRFAIRRGSGGTGIYRGGDGVIRELEFLKPLKVSILAERRGPYAPYGLRGGKNGDLGRNILIRAGGLKETLPAKITFDVAAYDRLEIHTPSGGGYGTE